MYTLTLLLLGIFSLYIAVFGFVRWDSAFLREGNTPVVLTLIILVAMVFLFYGLYLAYGWLKRCKGSAGNPPKSIKWGILFLILAGQMTFLLYFQPTLRYDALKTFDQAVEMLTTGTISGTYENGYFARYTNNYPITILTYWLLRLASACGLPASGYMLFVQLINVLLLDISLLQGYEILRRTRGQHTSLFYLILCAVCPSTYVWTGFYYTSTLAMPFSLGALLLFLRMREHADLPVSPDIQAHAVGKGNGPDPSQRKHLLQRLFHSFCLGLLLVMGYKLRATTLIMLIAIGIAALYAIPWKSFRAWFAQKKAWLCGTLISFFLACALTLGFWNGAVSNYVLFDYENTGFPAIHWVMMGMRWDGAFDLSDEEYTASFSTREEKVAADKELLLERIKEAGPDGLLALMGRKLLNTWVDGMDTYDAENSALRYERCYGKVYEYLLGNKDGLLVIYAQAFRVLQMLAIGIGCLAQLFRKWKYKETISPLFVCQLALLGGMAFHLIWETNPLYSIGFTFLALLLMADQLGLLFQKFELLSCTKQTPPASCPEQIQNSTDSKENGSASAVDPGYVCSSVLQKEHAILCSSVLRKGHVILCCLSLLCLVILLGLGKKQLVETPIEETTYRARQYQYNDEPRMYVQEYEEIYTQTFVTDQPFNCLTIDALNTVGQYNQSAFSVEIADEHGNLVYSNHRFLSGKVELSKLYTFSFDLVIPDGMTTYTITFAPGYIHGEDSLQFRYYATGNQDLYADGSLSIAGEEIKNGDLAFSIGEYQVTTYYNIKVYMLLCACLVLLGGAITFGVWRRGVRS